MKKYFVLPLLACVLATSSFAQNKEGLDVNPLLSVKKDKVEFTAGGRVGVDAAYYNTDFTPMKSGFAFTDARIHTSLSYGENWYMFAEADFATGNVKLKNVFAKYTTGNHSVKVGYYNEAMGMSLNTSSYSYRFISRASSANALAPGRALGVSYKFVNDKWFANQGIAAENAHNNQHAGFQGGAISGRWLFKPVNNDATTVHVGISARYAKFNTGEWNNGVLHQEYHIGSGLETNVDKSHHFLTANLPWVSSETMIGVEALAKGERYFLRGEYMYKVLGKERDDKRLFENQLGGLYSWGTLESWKAGNPLDKNNFSGGYVEGGFLLFGDKYSYDNDNAVIKGNKLAGSLEVVARYNFTRLNDIIDTDYYLYGNDTFYTDGNIVDYPALSNSVGGGNLHAFTLGLNYTINEHIQFLASYTFNKLDNVRKPLDINMDILQARIVIAF